MAPTSGPASPSHGERHAGESKTPMLSVGYLAGIGPFKVTANQPAAMRAFVNGAFNKGNSGGPVIDLQTKQVIGVVHAKLAPLPSAISSALDVLKGQRSGVMYTATTVDGKETVLAEAQVVAAILDHFQNQVQLVVGVMVLPMDLRAFLKANGIAP